MNTEKKQTNLFPLLNQSNVYKKSSDCSLVVMIFTVKKSSMLLMGRILVGKLAIGNEEFGLKVSAVAEGIERNWPVVLVDVNFFLQYP